MKSPMVCRVCLERDGVEAALVVEHRCTNQHIGKDFTAHVCARCLEAGRETRVTCRAFTQRPIKVAAKARLGQDRISIDRRSTGVVSLPAPTAIRKLRGRPRERRRAHASFGSSDHSS
jgi:hypothetical protein